MKKIILIISIFFASIPFVVGATFDTVERVSLSSAGVQGNSYSNTPEQGKTISADGRYVVFVSAATNLVASDTNATQDIFVYDRDTDIIERVSVADGAVQSNGTSRGPSISSDGRYVAFVSSATNLVAGDTNAKDDVFLYDRDTDTIERVSVATDGTQGNNHSGASFSNPSVSDDGRYVAFLSSATNLVASDSNAVNDVFVRDRDSDTTERVSVDSLGTQSNGSCSYLNISGDGIYVVMQCAATNLVTGDTNAKSDIFVYNRNTDVMERVSVDNNGTQANNNSYDPTISADGRYVGFESQATNLVAGDTNSAQDIFVYDRNTDTIELASANDDGDIANSDSYFPSISPDGRFIVFTSYATNLDTTSTTGQGDAFVFDLENNLVENVSLNVDGDPSTDYSDGFSISENGLYVVYYSPASNLVTGDSNGQNDVFVVSLSYISAPTTTTSISTEITRNTATLNGEMTDNGGENTTERGFEYGLDTSYGTTVSESGDFGVGVFSLPIEGLSCKTIYHYRSYATNSADTGYGSDQTFTTGSCTISTGSSSGGSSRQSVANTSTTTPTSVPDIPVTEPNIILQLKFFKNLHMGMVDPDVKELQKYLNTHGFPVAISGPGSPGNETEKFGALTKKALIKFQIANKISPAVGYFGPITRGVVNGGI